MEKTNIERVQVLINQAKAIGDTSTANYFEALLKENIANDTAPEKTLMGYKTVPLYAAEALVNSELPKAELAPVLYTHDGQTKECKHKKIVIVEGQPFDTVSNRYKLVQHSEAFLQVLEPLAGIDMNIGVNVGWYGDGATLDLIYEKELIDTVRAGFQVKSRHDGKSAISYSFSSAKVEKWNEIVEKTESQEAGASPDLTPKHDGGYRYIEMVGYRLACMNGMKIRIPLEEVIKNAATAPKEGVGSLSVKQMLTEVWTEIEQKERISDLIRVNSRILHMGKVKDKLTAQKNFVELMIALQEPAKRLIQRAMATKANERIAVDTFNTYLGERLGTEVYATASEPMNTAWGVYNAMTEYATHRAHNLREKNKLENASADYLVMLAPPVKAK